MDLGVRLAFIERESKNVVDIQLDRLVAATWIIGYRKLQIGQYGDLILRALHFNFEYELHDLSSESCIGAAVNLDD